MIKRFGKKEGIYSLVPPAIIYGVSAFIIAYAMWPYFYYIKDQTVIVLGLFAAWRYGWLLTNYVRAAIYAKVVYPQLKQRVESLPEEQRYPERLFFIIPSYQEEHWVSVESFQSIMSNMADIPCAATLVVAVGSDQEESLITSVYEAHPGKFKIDLIFQRQAEGKRIAMGHALRTAARHYHDEPNSVTILMDGDSWLQPGTLRKVIPFFTTFDDLGALTTNEIAYINTKSNWHKDWFNLKFGQRHVLFQSHSLSERVLTLTGRFSLLRTSIVVNEDFIRMVECDTITHWRHGRFRFLMGDDKSTWFYLLKHRWKMLYIPDVVCYSLESRDSSFLDVSLSLPYRWHGNTMRNNTRALALGSECTGRFIWIAILDQRLSMWTSLVGLFGALVLTLIKSFIYLPFYIAWVLMVRVVQMSAIALNGHPVSMRTIPLMLYNQWIGSFIKIRAFFFLSDQSWAKGTSTQRQQHQGIKHWLARYMPAYTMLLAYGIFATVLLVAEKALSIPDSEFFSVNKDIHTIDAQAYGVTPNDNLDDALALQTLLNRLPPHGTVKVRLPPGILDFKKPVIIRRSNLIITGDTQLETRIISHLLRPSEAVIRIAGSVDKKITTLTKTTTTDSKILTLNQPTAFNSGDYALLKMPNDAAFFEKIGSEVWQRPYPYLRQSIVKLTNVQAETIRIDAPTGIEFLAMKTTAQKIRPVKNITLRNFIIEQQVPGKQLSDVIHRYENLYPNYAVNGISLNWTADVTLDQITVLNAGRHPISIENSYGFTLRNCDIDGAWNKGDKGNGYLRIARSYRGSVTNCKIRNIRHITLQWSSAFNHLGNLYTEVDVNFHGGYTHQNSVENLVSNIPSQHPWPAVYRTPNNAHWAPPDGPGNTVSKP